MDPPGGSGSPSTFTGRLHELVGRLRSPEDLVLNIEGPYGPELAFRQPDVLLIAGGIGVTPMHNTLRFLAQGGAPAVERVHLVWAARSPQVFELFAETLPAEASSCAVEL